MIKVFTVHILGCKSRNLYIGMTSNITVGLHQHKTKAVGGFTARYNIDRLVYFEQLATSDGIAREKELKDWRRELKIKLIERDNPTWEDLSEDRLDSEGVERQKRIPTG